MLSAQTEAAFSAFNGLESVVIGALSITLGTLISTAVSVLRQRQQELRKSLCDEASLLETIAQQHTKLFRWDKGRLRRSMAILSAYIFEMRRSIVVSKEIGAGSGTSYWRAHWSAQSSRVTALLDVLAECGDAITSGPNFGFSPGSAAITIDKTETLLVRLNAARQERRSVLESAFPPGLYLTMACLMASLLYCFLLRADTISGSRSATLAGFLAETPVRALFVFMTTSFYAILQILADLDDPYSGAFRVDTSVTARGTASGAPSRSATSPRPSRRTSRPSTIGPTCASTTPWRTPRSGGKSLLIIRRVAPRRTGPAKTWHRRAPRRSSPAGGARIAAQGVLRGRLGEHDDAGEGRGERGEARGRGGASLPVFSDDIAANRPDARRDEVVVVVARRGPDDERIILGDAILDVAEGERERAGDVVVVEPPVTPRRGRAARRASGARGELAGTSGS